MAKLLEVIVTSQEEAREAEAGGADRLELVRCLSLGGLTPDFEVAASVLEAVSIPVRIMLRENASLTIADQAELGCLRTLAREFNRLPIDGFVLGFVKQGTLDGDSMRDILENAERPVTCHRAFEEVKDPLLSIEELKGMRRIDRILTSGGEGSWRERIQKLIRWQASAAPEIRILAGAGLCASAIEYLKGAQSISEIHVGRAARIPQTTSGVVSRERIRSLKSALQ